MNYEVIWSDEVITGIKDIDEQHKKIVEAINTLYRSIEENEDKDKIIELIESLDPYVNVHFDTEEKYMKQYHYPAALEHKEAHDSFKKIYVEIRYNYHYLGNKSSPQYKFVYILALHLSQIMIDWLNLHLNTLDKELATFLKTKIDVN
ncbi:MAG: hemerythrin family protein [Candidatus Gastranaerophilaceae bacterium]|jgi:hemerythrin-like metal-binding protein